MASGGAGLRSVSAAGLIYSPARVTDGRRKVGAPATALSFGPAVIRDGRRHLKASAALALGGGAALRFKMIGYNATSAAYEVWIALGTPNASPPSGHALNDIGYVPLKST